MDEQLKLCVAGSHSPTHSAKCGAKTTTPFVRTVVAPANFPSWLIVDAMDGQLKVCVAGSQSPTQLALQGAKTTTPSTVVVAPANFQSLLMVDAIDGHLKV